MMITIINLLTLYPHGHSYHHQQHAQIAHLVLLDGLLLLRLDVLLHPARLLASTPDHHLIIICM